MIPAPYYDQELPEDWAPVEELEIHLAPITDGLSDLTAMAEAYRHQADAFVKLHAEGWSVVGSHRGIVYLEREA